MAIDTYDSCSILDITSENEDRRLRLRRLAAEDAALRPWVVGRAISAFRYTWWSRVRLLVKEAVEAARFSWRTSR